jgi:hypothetical protein
MQSSEPGTGTDRKQNAESDVKELINISSIFKSYVAEAAASIMNQSLYN